MKAIMILNATWKIKFYAHLGWHVLLSCIEKDWFCMRKSVTGSTQLSNIFGMFPYVHYYLIFCYFVCTKVVISIQSCAKSTHQRAFPVSILHRTMELLNRRTWSLLLLVQLWNKFIYCLSWTVNIIFAFHLTTWVDTKLHPQNTNLSGSITVWMASCLFCLDSAALLMLN